MSSARSKPGAGSVAEIELLLGEHGTRAGELEALPASTADAAKLEILPASKTAGAGKLDPNIWWPAQLSSSSFPGEAAFLWAEGFMNPPWFRW